MARNAVDYPLMSAAEIAELLGYGRTKGYQVAKQLRQELISKGAIVPNRGLVPRAYVIERLGGLAEVKEAV